MDCKIADTKKPIKGHGGVLLLFFFEFYRIDSEHMNHVREKMPSVISWKSLPV